MKFYRRLQPFKAISFDLDDTLYHNQPIMAQTDKKMTAHFSEVFAQYPIKSPAKVFDLHFWWQFRSQALHLEPALKHDVALLRRQSYLLGCLALGLSPNDAQQVSAAALAYFVEQRSQFSLPPATHQLLTFLQKKCPLVAITNGNVDIHRIGIAGYFSHHYHASISNRQKPAVDMFAKACQALAIVPTQLLHIGDCGHSDVYGGVNAGCQTAWLSRYSVGKPIKVLPTFEITAIEQLGDLFV